MVLWGVLKGSDNYFAPLGSQYTPSLLPSLGRFLEDRLKMSARQLIDEPQFQVPAGTAQQFVRDDELSLPQTRFGLRLRCISDT
jgi:hypothetical protein